MNLRTTLSGLLIIIVGYLPHLVIAAEMSPEVPLELEKPSYSAPWQRYTGRRWARTDWKNFSNLRHEVLTPVSTYQKIETPIKGNPENGKKLVADRKRGGGCVACHIMPDTAMPGNIGPDLSTIGAWKRPDEFLFNYIYDARQFNPYTNMPPWGAHNLFHQDEIKDIVAYLQTLTEPTHFKTPTDDPTKRPVPVETRDNLDEFENPAMFSLELGEELFSTPGPKNQSCQSCHAEATELKTWAATMPKFETRLNKVIGVEEFVTRHALATTGAEYLAQSKQNLALAIYLRYLANGQTIAIDQSDANTQAAIKRGKALMERKIGQINRACVDCHITNVKKWIRGQYLVPRKGMYEHFPTYRTSRGAIWDIRKRIQWCGVSVRANELPPDAPEYGDLEIYLATLNNGQILNVPGLGH
ncbi:MAG: sulfur oxidation c-type cytochrome SoxX [Gammaproteobacteria bacterium]|nr:MAG: sulfur oxidation c-type cytochrome SoxX [Gammaproteobacteria bacterium]RKZ39328.1 MAG: sulfur oxidation c-type cytochrome SoxX [Gammaproteobacteria bacterium]RKZ72962.1 MAG: sulfur oxidation c-type cytochrome SoxX [Gammaproteobacteria bacterium]